MNWEEVKPALEETYRLLEDQEQISRDAVCEALGRPASDEHTILALTRLYEGGYIDGITYEESAAPIFISSTEKGLREVSGWPGDGSERYVELLIQLLDERIEDPETPERERGKLRRIRGAAADAAPDFFGKVLAAYTAKVIPPAS